MKQDSNFYLNDELAPGRLRVVRFCKMLQSRLDFKLALFKFSLICHHPMNLIGINWIPRNSNCIITWMPSQGPCLGVQLCYTKWRRDRSGSFCPSLVERLQNSEQLRSFLRGRLAGHIDTADHPIHVPVIWEQLFKKVNRRTNNNSIIENDLDIVSENDSWYWHYFT